MNERLNEQIEICRGNKECADKMATAAGSLLTGRRLADWMHSPTGRMSMQRSGMRMRHSGKLDITTEYLFDDNEW